MMTCSTNETQYTETGTWATYDSKQSILEVTEYTSAHNLERIFVSVLSRSTTQKAKNQDKEGVLHMQRQLTLFKFERSKDFESAQNTQAV